MAMFSDAAIPAHTAETVRRLAARGRLPQSILLTGGSARLRERCGGEIAGALLCRTPKNGEPCGKCPACVRLKAGTHPDLIRVVPEADRKTVSIKTVRELVLDQLYTAPNESENKIFLFPDAEELSVLIQNALLKSMEEPPPFVCFILLCAVRETLLETVISRCTEFPLGETGTAGGKNTATAAGIAAEIAEALCTGNEMELLLRTAPMTKKRELMVRVADALILIFRDAMIGDAGAPYLSGADRQAALLARRFSVPALLRMKAAMDKIKDDASHNANETLLLCEFSALLLEAAS